MDPFTLALLGGTSLASGALSYAGARQAAGAQSAAAQQSGILGLIAQQQAQQQAQQLAERGAAAAGDYYNRGTGDVREFYGRGRTDLLNQADIGEAAGREFYGQGVGFQQPYMGAGAAAINQLSQLYGPGGVYTKQPTYDELSLDPGYNFRIQQGQQAMLNAARGGGLAGSGAALKAASRYGAGEASQEYQNAYARFMANRAAVTQGLQNIAGTGAGAAGTATGLAGQVGTNLMNQRFGAGANLGQAATTAGSNLGTLASNAGATAAGAYTGAIPTMAALSSGNPYGQAMENVGQARASGYVGGASALGNALQGPANAMMAYTMMNRFAPNRASIYAPAGGATAANYPGPNAGYELNY